MDNLVVVEKSHLSQIKAELEKTEKLYEKIRKLEDLVRSLRAEYWKMKKGVPLEDYNRVEAKLIETQNDLARTEVEAENYQALWEDECTKTAALGGRIQALEQNEEAYRLRKEKAQREIDWFAKMYNQWYASYSELYGKHKELKKALATLSES